MYSVLNTLSEYTCFYISKDNTLYTFLLVFKIVERLHFILKVNNLTYIALIFQRFRLSRYKWFFIAKNPDKFSLVKKETHRVPCKNLYRINIKCFTSKSSTLVSRAKI